MDRLWSPWRYRYVSTCGETHGCIFCDKPAEQKDEENLIVKKLYPMGGCRYWHLKKASDDWRTVSNVEPDPGKAIERARMG